MNPQKQLPFASVSDETRCDDYSGVPGLTYARSYLSAEAQAYAMEMIDQREWQLDLRRRVQQFGYRYDYRTRRVDRSMYLGELPGFAKSIAERLLRDGLMPELPDQMIVNEYVPGQGITPHVDCEPCFGNTIATISLGSVYTMDLFDCESNDSRKIDLDAGSCLVFSGGSRYRWKHGIKARKSDNGRRRGRRVSMTFRTVLIDELATEVPKNPRSRSVKKPQ